MRLIASATAPTRIKTCRWSQSTAMLTTQFGATAGEGAGASSPGSRTKCPRSIAILHLQSCYCRGDRDGSSNLRGAQQIAPEQRRPYDLLRHNNHVSRIEPSRQYVACIPVAGVASDHGSIRANDEDFMPIRNLSRAAGSLQIPTSRFSRRKRDRCSVVNLSRDQNESGSFGNAQNIVAAHLDISGRACPAIDIGIDMDHQASTRRLAFEAREHLLLLLLDDLQRR